MDFRKLDYVAVVVLFSGFSDIFLKFYSVIVVKLFFVPLLIVKIATAGITVRNHSKYSGKRFLFKEKTINYIIHQNVTNELFKAWLVYKIRPVKNRKSNGKLVKIEKRAEKSHYNFEIFMQYTIYGKM